ncbi:uncharacterized protein ACIBXB_006127 [Morphnus guianensis]
MDASFLSGNTGEPVHHDCLETIEATYASHPDLKDSPMENGETWFTDRSSYVLNGNRHAGYAITTSQESLTEKTLEPQWEGPFQVLLTSFTAIRIKEQNAWIHHTRVKKTPKTPWKVTTKPDGHLVFTR